MADQTTAPNNIVLDCFELLRELGSGSFATAYLARQQGCDRFAVVKVAHPHLINHHMGEMVRARFAAEFRAMTKVRHPNLVQAFATGETPDGLPALAMEFIEGVSLEDILEEHGRLPLSSARAVFDQLAGALAAVHEEDVIHRDVTPSNVMLTRDHRGQPQVKLLDFGIAKLGEMGTRFTNGPIGTPHYLAPEQIIGETGRASDLFSLGAIMWRALVGNEFLEEAEGVSRYLLTVQMMTEVPDPRVYQPSIPDEIAEIMRRLLDPDPQKRPTAAAFVEEWRALAWSRWGASEETPRESAPGLESLETSPPVVEVAVIDRTASRHRAHLSQQPIVPSGAFNASREAQKKTPRGLFSFSRDAQQTPGRETRALRRAPRSLSERCRTAQSRSSAAELRSPRGPSVRGPMSGRLAVMVGWSRGEDGGIGHWLSAQGAQVLSVSSTQELSALIDAQTPDIILVSSKMPVYRLIGLARWLRQRRQTGQRGSQSCWLLVSYERSMRLEISQFFDSSLPIHEGLESLQRITYELFTRAPRRHANGSARV